MLTFFIISFIVLCCSLMIVLEVGNNNATSWLMIAWRGLLVLSTIGSLVSFVYILMSEYNFDIFQCFFPVFILAAFSFIGGALLWLTLSIIAWIWGIKVCDIVHFLTGIKD